MSKTTLRKATASFSADEMRQLLFELYEKSKEAKEWLDFYADPDVGKKLEAYKKPVLKEVERYSRRAHRPRVARIRPVIKKFASFDPGDAAVAELMVFAALGLVRVAATNVLPDANAAQVVRFFGDTVDFLKSRLMLDDYLPQFEKALRGMEDFHYYRNPLRERFGAILADAIAENV